MAEMEKKQSVYENPELEIIPLNETDVISTSGGPFENPDQEGELTPIYGFNNLK